MNFKIKIFGVMPLTLIGGLLILETGFSGAQTPAAVQDDGAYHSMKPTATIAEFNAAGYEATPRPKPVHRRWKLVIPPKVKPNLTPRVTIIPVGTVVTAQNTHSTHDQGASK